MDKALPPPLGLNKLIPMDLLIWHQKAYILQEKLSNSQLHRLYWITIYDNVYL